VEDSWSPSQQTLEGHLDLVQSVAFSSDGQTLASGSSDNTIKLWDTKTGKELQTLTGHLDLVDSVANTLPTEGHPGTGSSNIPLLCGDHDPTLSNFKPQASLSNNWVALAGENLLWLPPEYRQYSCLAFKDATLALGYGDRRVSILGFHIS
jgi:WD40 repeat protein